MHCQGWIVTVAVGLHTKRVTLLGTDVSLGPFPSDPERPALEHEGCMVQIHTHREVQELSVLIPNMCQQCLTSLPASSQACLPR